MKGVSSPRDSPLVFEIDLLRFLLSPQRVMEQGEREQPRSEPAGDVDWSECEHSQGPGVPIRLTRGASVGEA